ncbi:MAG: 3-oxoacyl-ACP reductase FabG [Bacillota bacterium]|nr:3-oxoacyl-ACP reductase FabG [Bacillota bacterium]
MNRTVLITGGSRGIGRATAELFAEQGDKVMINYLHSESQAVTLYKSLREKGYMAEIYAADIAVESDVKELFSYTNEVFGNVDILINNAGIAQQKLFCDITEDEWHRMFDVNITGTFHCCKNALPSMINKKRGKIINVSSIWGISGASCEVHYSASKAAIIGLTRALAKEVGPSNIQVNCVAPGIISTEMNAFLSNDDIESLCCETPLGRFGKPIDIANSILFLASEKADFITGQVLSPNGGFVI